MNKKIVAMVLAFLLTIGLCGCQLAKSDGDSQPQKDRLVGVFITREHVDLYDMDDITIKNGELERPVLENDGKLYAVFTEETYSYSEGEEHTSKTYAFPDLDGMLLAHFQILSDGEAYTASAVDEGICDIHSRVGGSDAGISGTIWTAKDSGEVIFYLNPVYQTADGQVYLIPGSGIHFSSGVGGRATQKKEETYTVTENGGTVEEHFAVEVAIDVTEPAETVTILQMDTENREISRQTYRADSLPEELTPDAGTAYFIVQSNTKTEAQRQICQPGDEYTDVFVRLDQQLCTQKSIYVNWE